MSQSTITLSDAMSLPHLGLMLEKLAEIGGLLAFSAFVLINKNLHALNYDCLDSIVITEQCT